MLCNCIVFKVVSLEIYAKIFGKIPMEFFHKFTAVFSGREEEEEEEENLLAK